MNTDKRDLKERESQRLGLSAFRQAMKACRERYPHHWAASRAYVTPDALPETLQQITDCLQTQELDPPLRSRLLQVLHQCAQPNQTKLTNPQLKELTGLPPTKALRAIIVWGLLAGNGTEAQGAEALSGEEVESIIRHTTNPFDLLRHSTTPSLLDIGAGDLTFERELVEQMIPTLPEKSAPFTLHAFDRLKPGSSVGGVYHKNDECERFLRNYPAEDLQFTFWGGKDLEQFKQLQGPLSRYTISTCFAPANPTFAYEPSRISPTVIRDHLRSTRGNFRRDRMDGEAVLEVSHEGRVLTFPPWKFDIVGPLALLELMVQRSAVGILAAVDDEVFWEMLSQLLEGEQYRPPNRLFSRDTLPGMFGEVYQRLSSCKAGERVDLSDVAPLREALPFSSAPSHEPSGTCRLRYVEIRRGALLEGVPSSFTAKQYAQMKEESIPWWIMFVPDR